MSDNLERRLSGLNQQSNTLSVDLSRIANLATRMSQSSVNALMGQDNVWRLAIEQMVEIEVKRQINESAGLKEVTGRLEALEKKEKSDVQVMQEKESLSAETSIHERMSKAVNEFQSCIPIFVASLGVLLTISLPCNTLGFFLQVIITGCCVLFLLGGLTAFRIWVISNDAAFLKEVFKSLKGQKSNYETRSYDAEGGDETSNMVVHKFYSRWWYMWPHFMKLIMLVYFSVMFAAAVGVFVHSKKCVTVIPEAPAPAPVEEHWPLLLATG